MTFVVGVLAPLRPLQERRPQRRQTNSKRSFEVVRSGVHVRTPGICTVGVRGDIGPSLARQGLDVTIVGAHYSFPKRGHAPPSGSTATFTAHRVHSGP
jgi:hypothetical protein